MSFQHADDLWRDFPSLVPVALLADGITSDVPSEALVERFEQRAEARVATTAPGQLPEIQAWRRAFAQMGLKPTQYRCASESLLRRYTKEGSLPRIHPLVDLCNAVSIAYAIPVAAFDLSGVTGDLHVRYAEGDEKYLTFAGDVEQPEPGEVIFVDAAGNAHARRWSNRQSGRSAVQNTTGQVLIVAEALHTSASADIDALAHDLADSMTRMWGSRPSITTLSRSAPRFEF